MWHSKMHFTHSMRMVAVNVEEHCMKERGSHLGQCNNVEVRVTALCNKEVLEWDPSGFREGEHAANEDITKMYNLVWLEKQCLKSM